MRVVLLLLAALCVAGPVRAQLIPLTDDRHIEANVLYLGTSDHEAADGPGSFQAWAGSYVEAFVPGPSAGSSSSSAFQSSAFYISGLFYSGGSEGSWNVIPGEHYDALSHLRWKVRANQCIEYAVHMEVDPGDVPGSAWVEIRGPGGRVCYLDGGVVDTTGRLSSGDYIFEGESSVSTWHEVVDGGTYSLEFSCNVCPSTPIGVEPSDVTVACNQTATFCVTPAGPVGSFTYQWRHNGQPLANSAHYSGVTTNCLAIFHACFADAGSYDCLVTVSGISTPTRAAQLTTTPGPVGVEPSAGGWSLGLPSPNPSFASTSLRYEAAQPFFARVTIHDAAGRIVRRLADRMLEPAGTLTWDGRSDSGTPAVPGVYFLRLEMAGRTEVRRLLRVR